MRMVRSCACRIARPRGGAAAAQWPRFCRVASRQAVVEEEVVGNSVLPLLLLPRSIRRVAIRRNLRWCLAEYEAHTADLDLGDNAVAEV